MEIYLDESGNLGGLGVQGLKDPYFIIAVFIVREDLPIKRCIKDIRRRKIKKKYKVISELKLSNSGDNLEKGSSSVWVRPIMILPMLYCARAKLRGPSRQTSDYI